MSSNGVIVAVIGVVIVVVIGVVIVVVIVVGIEFDVARIDFAEREMARTEIGAENWSRFKSQNV